MKARPIPTPHPDAVSAMSDHGDRLDTLERKNRDRSNKAPFLREHCFIISAVGGYTPPTIPVTPP